MSHLPRRVCSGAFLVLACAAIAAPAGAATRDYAGTALNIVPSGQLGGVPAAADADRQARMYDALTPLFDKVTAADLKRDFKSESLGTPKGTVKAEKLPRKGVRIVRDAFHVPHITATTRDSLTWATGWVEAEDRGLLLEQARYDSRVAAVDAPSLKAIPLVSGLRQFVPSAQTEAEVAKQTGVLKAAGSRGRRLLHDIDVYITGINAYLTSQKSASKPWTRNDVYAFNALKGQFLGEGGGDETRRSQLLATLQGSLGADPALRVFDDLRQRDVADHPTSIDGSFPYAAVPASKAGNVIVDPGSFEATFTPAPTTAPARAATGTDTNTYASNILMISGKKSATGHPLFVGGPQIGYFYPGLTLEMELHAPGVDVRGVTAAPFPGYMLIGRGPDYAWTLTSAGADIVDQFVETLCGDDTHYTYQGQCRAMTTFDAGLLKGAGAAPDQQVTYPVTVHGPVIGYATVGGRRVAISRKRSSYGKDTLDQLAFQGVTDSSKIHSAKDFQKAFLRSPQTFNAFYADDKDIAEVTTGALPLRAPDVDPGLPTDGTGGHEWHGFLAASKHPQGKNPKRGQIVNWNNKVARGFNAADGEFTYGSIQRVDLLNRNLARLAVKGKQTLATVTSAMNAAATQDVRGVESVPTLSKLLRTGDAPSPRAQRMLELLEAWNKAGATRLDRDLDGKIDDPGVAIMDAAWPKLADAAMGPVLGDTGLTALATVFTRYDLPPAGQSGGWHSYLDRDLRTLLGEKLKQPLNLHYCGAGDLATCRGSLWTALDAAGAGLEAAQGPDPAAWRADALRERITFVPGLLPFTMRYTNRPTGIQQVITFAGHRPVAKKHKGR